MIKIIKYYFIIKAELELVTIITILYLHILNYYKDYTD